MYGFTDDKAAIQTNSLKFGLNQKVKMTNFIYNPNGGSGGSAGDCIDVNFLVGDSEVGARFFPVEKVFDKNMEITDPNHPKFKEEVKQLNAALVHIMSCFVPKTSLQKGLAGPFASFAEFAKKCQQGMAGKFEDKLVDLFLQYDWQLKGDSTMKFLRVPTKMKHGNFICPHIDKEFEEQRGKGQYSLFYVAEDGSRHPFVRGDWFMNSPFSKQERKEDDGIPADAIVPPSDDNDPFAMPDDIDSPEGDGLPDPFADDSDDGFGG